MSPDPPPVAFIGDINVDLLMAGLRSPPVEDREVLCESFDIVLGSSAVIAACTYSHLGGRARFFGLAGNDYFGRFMLRGMKDCGIDTAGVRFTDRAKTGVTVSMAHRSTRTQVTYPGAIPLLRAADIDREALWRCRHAHFTGVYLQDGLRGDLADLLRQARERGLSTSLDSQWDPAGTWQGLAEWLPLLDIFFCNQDEARSITGEEDARKACLVLRRRTARPLVKLGAEGALYCDEPSQRVVHAPTRRVEAVDTTGAGDAFDAGFLYAALDRRMDLPEAVRFANAVGTRCCLFRGGVEARSTYPQILEFLKEAP